MNLKADIEKRIDKKRAEISTLDSEIAERQAKKVTAEAVMQELLSLLKSASKDGDAEANTAPTEKGLRAGSDVYKAREALRLLKQNTYVDEILETMGKPVNKQSRRSLSSQLSWHAKRDMIFTKPESNIFGLKEWGKGLGSSQAQDREDDDLQGLALPLESEEAH